MMIFSFTSFLIVMDFSVTMSERERAVGNSPTEMIKIPFSCDRAGGRRMNTALSHAFTKHGEAFYDPRGASCARGQKNFGGAQRRSNWQGAPQ
ncbi:hypothetical protein BraRD5C2_54640 [Bradyrhizobium sp. RD5-C2]|nr:hypothetical protein BraRD5C2_54640 [Bradyrhizobium sp. RD5-C2]